MIAQASLSLPWIEIIARLTDCDGWERVASGGAEIDGIASLTKECLLMKACQRAHKPITVSLAITTVKSMRILRIVKNLILLNLSNH